MSKRRTSIIAASLLATTLFAASPAVFADKHSDHRGDGPRDMTEMCENMREGKGPFNKAERQEKMAEKRDAMAERLKLNDEQRKIWNDIHEERREEQEKRAEKMMEKMKKRCDQQKK
ncbi:MULTISPECIES: hypothetical protein [unclassified Marinobacter]|uniref:hypothetical protein n=1 Tax=unclassified Marinobacter TaxID=83889 RepID=UPI0026E2B1FF|nr:MULTISPECIES: hypothetical protein [unclassified Marinobacter]MDO6442673.1 hypothetical protein [Marinobacter sp. 2_MG-2023]MDO6823110.1 hypothetical protein [Marinobacter sp. 1_MG-2023]